MNRFLPLLILIVLSAGSVRAQWWWGQPSPQESPAEDWWQGEHPQRKPRPAATPQSKRSKNRKKEGTQTAGKTSSAKEAAPRERTTVSLESANPFHARLVGPRNDADVEKQNPVPENLPPARVYGPETSSGTRRMDRLPEPKEWPAAVPPREPPTRDGYTSIVWSYRDGEETLAKACGVTFGEILEANNLKRGELRDGQVLRVPIPDIEPPPMFSAETQAAREIWRGIRGRRQIALTLDAGGESDGLSELLRNLKENGIPATFFVTGEFVRSNSESVKEIVNAGFPVHNHTWSHPELPKLADGEIIAQFGKTEQILREATGRSSLPFWRPPFGERDARTLRIAAEQGYQSVYWTLDSLDSVGEKKSPEFIVERVTNPPRHADPERFLDGAIILMHVGEPRTAEAIPRLAEELRKMGFEFVNLEQIVSP